MNHNFKQNFIFIPVSIKIFLISYFVLWTVKQLVAHSVNLVRIGLVEQCVGFFWPASITPRHSFLQYPAAAGLAASQCLWQGKGGWRWIRGMTKICLALTPFWVAGYCHTAREHAITVTFSHFKALRQVWFLKAVAHYWSTGPDFIQGLRMVKYAIL